MSLLTILSFVNTTSPAQNNNSSINMNMNHQSEWYLHPALWVVAAVILGVLVIAALRGDIKAR
jgi:hypothetical protein